MKGLELQIVCQILVLFFIAMAPRVVDIQVTVMPSAPSG